MTPFDIVLVPFPFSDLTAVKQRPCLVLTGMRPKRLPQHFIVALITSHLEGIRFPFDHEIIHWKEAGLPKPSLIRLAKVVTIDATIVRKRLGSIAGKDQAAVCLGVSELFKSIPGNRPVR
jgi:mRNA interferase MazF